MDNLTTFNASDAFRGNELTFTISIKVVRDWRFRIGFWLIALGCRTLRCRLKTEDVA